MERIFLTGPKHSGKTTAGKILALISCSEFIDTDELITKKTGKSPRQLFDESPDRLKSAEAQAVSELSAHSAKCRRLIIATGGGIIDNPEAVKLLKEMGTIVYLNVSVGTAWQRIVKSGELPAFLQTENPQETHRILHERRAAAYLQLADFTVEAEGKTPAEIAEICVA